VQITTVYIQDKQRINIGTQHLKQAHFMERNDIRIDEGSTENIFSFLYVVQSFPQVMYQNVHIYNAICFGWSHHH
jgi:hypothetical protein